MARWVHRITKQFLDSTSPASLPEPRAKYIENPDISAVTGFSNRYWTIIGDVISLMSQSERDAVDVAEEQAQLDAIADELQQVRTLTRAFAEVVLDEINLLRSQHSLSARTLTQLRNAVRGKL